MPLTVDELTNELAHHLQDPAHQMVNRNQLLAFINSAAWDVANEGWNVDLQDDESIYIATATFEYAIPTGFSFMHDLWEEGTPVDVVSNLNEVLDTTETGVDVVDGTLYAVNDRIRIDNEWMLVTAIVVNTLTVTRAILGTTAATHALATAIFRGPGTYYNWIPWARWQMKVGGANAPTLWLDDQLFTINIGRRIRLLGQGRPTTEYIGKGTIDTGMESFIRERAVAYAARNMSRHGGQHATQYAQLAQEAWETSEMMLKHQAELFQPKRTSRKVPGR